MACSRQYSSLADEYYWAGYLRYIAMRQQLPATAGTSWQEFNASWSKEARNTSSPNIGMNDVLQLGWPLIMRRCEL